MKKKNFSYIFFLGLVAYFFIISIKKNIIGVAKYQIDFDLFYLIISILIYVITTILLGVYWSLILKSLHYGTIKTKKIIAITLCSWIGRYIPGKIGLLSTRYIMGKKEKIPTETIVLSILYENIFVTISAILISTPFVCIASWDLVRGTKSIANQYALLVTLIFLTGIIGLNYFYKIINTLLKIVKKEAIPKENFLSKYDIIKFTFLYSISNVINGFAFVTFVHAMTIPTNDIAIYIGSFYIFSSLAGLLAVFSPAGLGVKEGVLLFLLQQHYSQNIALMLTIFSRLWTSFSDIIVAIIGIFLKRKER